MDDDRELWAHSRNVYGRRHRLADHLRGTAALARGFGEHFGAGDLAEFVGLAHDVGKSLCTWQNGLLRAESTGGPVGLDHKTAGAWLAADHVSSFALAVFGHHGGLPSRDDLLQRLRNLPDGEKARLTDAIDRAAEVVPEVKPAREVVIPTWYRAVVGDESVTDVLVRFVASALFDADYLDTERHFAGAATARAFSAPSVQELADRYEHNRTRYLRSRPRSPVDGLRDELYQLALSRAAGPGGVYRMPAPTGSGKTIASGGFALAHAAHHDLRRVVVAVPYISITEQNAEVYRQLLEHDSDAPVVLEHHSSIDTESDISRQEPWRRLAAENWDAPFVVTTTVQLFASLFSNRPSAMRKLHRLARSVIVLDEVQALPDRLLVPILSALRVLSSYFGTTVVLASATQPEFWELTPFRDVPCHDIVPDADRFYAQLRRVRYRWWTDPKPRLAQVAQTAAPHRQVLIIANTTADAATLHGLVAETRDAGLGPVHHLSTRMAAQHRKDVLAAINARLDDGQPVAVIATRLVEAGVDLDFPTVYRALASADSLLQAAGRANRNGHLTEGGVVVIFDPVDGGHPRNPYYRSALNPTTRHFGPDLADPDRREALAAYYRDRYGLQGLTGSDAGMQSGRHHLGGEIEEDRHALRFPDVAHKFDFFADEYTRQVVVTSYGDEATRSRIADCMHHLATGKPPGRWAYRALQPFTATVPRQLATAAIERGYAELVGNDLLVWHGPYHEQRGVYLPDTSEAYVW